MIANILTFTPPQTGKGTRSLRPAFPPSEVVIGTLDFGSVTWTDSSTSQTVTARSAIFAPVIIMGSSAKTPYKTGWQDQDARLAFLTQLELSVPPSSMVG